MDKLVEEMARKLAMFMFDTYGDAEGVVWAGLDARQREKATKAAQACFAIAQKRVNELEALVEQMGGGCDANCGGLHSAMQQGREGFCPDCGLMLKRVAYVLPHVKPEVARAALPTMLKGNGDG